MKKLERLTANILKDKELTKKINSEPYSGIEDFIRNAQRYIRAIKEGRMCCIIDKVSASGMSRTLKFVECNGTKSGGFGYYNFYLLFKILGFEKVRDSDCFRVHGCGMDMVFHTNYTIIHKLHRLGFINNKQCDHLAQQTPTTI